MTRSEAEVVFIERIRTVGLPVPEANVVVHGYEVDFLWRRERLVVELDGRAWHSQRDSFERDRRRAAVLTSAGFRVIRVTWRMLTEESQKLVVQVAQVLARART